MVCKDDAGSSKRKVIGRNFWSQVVGSKPIPNENDDSPSSCACVLLLRSEASCQSDQHEGENTQENKKSYFHGSPPRHEEDLVQTGLSAAWIPQEKRCFDAVPARYGTICLGVQHIIVLFLMQFGDKRWISSACGRLSR